MPVFGHRDEGAHLIGIRPLRTQEMDKRLGKRINYYRTLGSRILPDLRREIKQRRDYSGGGNQLRGGVDGFQSHNQCLTKELENDDVNLVSCSGGLFIAL